MGERLYVRYTLVRFFSIVLCVHLAKTATRKKSYRWEGYTMRRFFGEHV